MSFLKEIKGWFEYLFEDFWDYKNRELNFWTIPICRFKGHPAGIVFYNSNGWEPDYTCKTCGDMLN